MKRDGYPIIVFATIVGVFTVIVGAALLQHLHALLLPPAIAQTPANVLPLVWTGMDFSIDEQKETCPIRRVYRAQVPGGWLLVVMTGSESSMAYVPDARHKWSEDD